MNFLIKNRNNLIVLINLGQAIREMHDVLTHERITECGLKLIIKIQRKRKESKKLCDRLLENLRHDILVSFTFAVSVLLSALSDQIHCPEYFLS